MAMARDEGDDYEVKMQQQEVSCWDYCILKMRRKKSSRAAAATAASHHVHDHDNNRQRTSVGWSDVVKDAFTRSKRHFKSSSIGGGGSRGGGFRYDAISYSQNFDDGGGLDDEEALFRGFSSRYAAPVSHSSSSSSRE